MKYIKSGSLAVVAAALLWSLDGLLRRHLYSLPAPVIVFWEHAFGFVILLPFIIASIKVFKKLTRKQWMSITLVAFLSGAVGTIFYTAALGRVQFIPFSVVVLLQQLNPIFAIGAAAMLLKEPLGKRFFALSGVALVAGYFLSFPDLTVNLSTGSGTMVAALFAVGAAASWGVSTAFSKFTLEGIPALHVTSLRFGITPIFALMFVFLSGSSKSLTAMAMDQFKYIVFITFSTGLVALLIYYWGLKRVMASRAAILELAWPASAVFVGYFFLKEGFTVTQILGTIAMTASIYFIAKDDKQSKLKKTSK